MTAGGREKDMKDHMHFRPGGGGSPEGSPEHRLQLCP